MSHTAMQLLIKNVRGQPEGPHLKWLADWEANAPDGWTLLSASARWPRPEWRADLPLVPERVDDPAEPPPVLVAHRRRFRRAGGYRPPDNRVGVCDHEQRPTGRAVDRARAETLHCRRGRSHPERRLADTELRDDVVVVAHTMKDGCAKRGLVEGQRLAGTLDPQLGLDARHRGSSTEYEHPAYRTPRQPHRRLPARLRVTAA